MALVTFTDASGNEVVVTPSNPLPTSTGASSGASDPVKVTGSLGALNAVLAISQGSRDTLVAHVQGTFVGTIVLQGSGDGTNWITLNGATQWQNIATNVNVASITTGGLYQTTISALPFTRVLMSAYTSGTATLVLEAVDGNAAVFLDSPLPTGNNTIGNVGLANGGTFAAIKSGATAVATTDNALVVGISPNSMKASGVAPATTDPALVAAISPNSYAAASASLTANLAASVNGTVVKASAGTVFEFDVSNYTGTAFYFKLYNSTTVTVGTTVPTQVWLIPTGGTTTIEFGQLGKRLTAGVSYSTTANVTDADATAIVLTSGPAKVGVTYI